MVQRLLPEHAALVQMALAGAGGLYAVTDGALAGG